MSATFNKIKKVDRSKLEGNALKAYDTLKEETENFDLDTAVALNLDDDVERLAKKLEEKFPQSLGKKKDFKIFTEDQAKKRQAKASAKKKPKDITSEEWKNKPKDSKSIIDGQKYILQAGAKGQTELVPVNVKKSEPKPKKKKKAKKKDKPKSSGGNTGSFSKLRSAIAKREGISYKDALSIAKKEYAEAKKEAADQDREKRSKRIEKFKKQYKGRGVGASDLDKDAKISAKPIGKRISKNNKVYYEYRDNRTDVKQPQPSDYPKLAEGGKITYPTEIIKGLMAKGGEVENENAIYEWNTMDRFHRLDFLNEIEEDVNIGEDRFSMKTYMYDDLPPKVRREVQNRLSYAKGGKLSDKKMKRGASKEYYGYFRGYRPNTTQYMLLDDNYAAIVTKYRNSDSIDDYDIYDDKFQFRGSASGIKQGESGKQKVSLRKADFEKAKSFKDLYTNKKRDMSMAMMRAKGGNITHD